MHDIDNKMLIKQCAQVKIDAKTLALSSTEQKNAVLSNMLRILGESSQQLVAANELDLSNAQRLGLSHAMLDRLKIDHQVIQQMQQAIENIIRLDDPLSTIFPEQIRPNGLVVTKKKIPLGVILMIYESRPNVTVEAAALAIKSGNGIILRGGKEAFETNQVIASCWSQALAEAGMGNKAIYVLETTQREVLDHLLKLDDYIDVVIPRGGEGLIRHVVSCSHIPVIKHYQGVCHLFVDEFADLEMALELLINGKTQRPGVCNALEGVIVHQAIAKTFLPMMQAQLETKGVTVYACEKARAITKGFNKADETKFLAEFLDLQISCKVIEHIDQAIDFIDRYGSGHTEVIVTESQENAQEFINRVDASVVMVNASSRFSDGGELGLGAEIGISTSKIHAYGPMGLDSLTSEKFVVVGEGQVR